MGCVCASPELEASKEGGQVGLMSRTKRLVGVIFVGKRKGGDVNW